MGNAYIFSLTPTFTQGLVLGQLSILFLLVVILKYLFFDAVSDQPYKSFSYQPRIPREDEDVATARNERELSQSEVVDGKIGVESADWLNILLHQVCKSSSSVSPQSLNSFSSLR